MKLGQLLRLASLNLVAIVKARRQGRFEDVAYSISESEPQRWERYQQMIVVRFNFTTASEAAAVENVIRRFPKDVWAHGKGFVDIGMDEKDLAPVLSVLPSSLGSAHTTLINDVASLVQSTFPAAYRSRHAATAPMIQEVLLDSESRWTRAWLTEDDAIFFKDYQPLSVRRPMHHPFAVPLMAHPVLGPLTEEASDGSSLTCGWNR